VLIIYAHPNPKSFTHAVLESLVKGLESAKAPYEVLDLYAIGFNPVLVVDETRRRRDMIHDAETQRFRDALGRASHVVHVYPIRRHFLPRVKVSTPERRARWLRRVERWAENLR